MEIWRTEPCQPLSRKRPGTRLELSTLSRTLRKARRRLESYTLATSGRGFREEQIILSLMWKAMSGMSWIALLAIISSPLVVAPCVTGLLILLLRVALLLIMTMCSWRYLALSFLITAPCLVGCALAPPLVSASWLLTGKA